MIMINKQEDILFINNYAARLINNADSIILGIILGIIYNQNRGYQFNSNLHLTYICRDSSTRVYTGTVLGVHVKYAIHITR